MQNVQLGIVGKYGFGRNGSFWSDGFRACSSHFRVKIYDCGCWMLLVLLCLDDWEKQEEKSACRFRVGVVSSYLLH